jgi:hypothetical protein
MSPCALTLPTCSQPQLRYKKRNSASSYHFLSSSSSASQSLHIRSCESEPRWAICLEAESFFAPIPLFLTRISTVAEGTEFTLEAIVILIPILRFMRSLVASTSFVLLAFHNGGSVELVLMLEFLEGFSLQRSRYVRILFLVGTTSNQGQSLFFRGGNDYFESGIPYRCAMLNH